MAEVRRHARAVETQDAGARLLAQLADEPAAAVASVRDRQVDREDADLEHVAGLGAFDVDRAGQNVAARPAVRDPLVDRPQLGLDLVRGQTGRLETLRAVRDQGLDLHDVARSDPERGRLRRIVVPPRDRGRRGRQPMDAGLRIGAAAAEPRHVTRGAESLELQGIVSGNHAIRRSGEGDHPPLRREVGETVAGLEGRARPGLLEIPVQIAVVRRQYPRSVPLDTDVLRGVRVAGAREKARIPGRIAASSPATNRTRPCVLRRTGSAMSSASMPPRRPPSCRAAPV
jgi:hypothetical protein